MLQKNKCCNECSCFERSERVFQDKMDTWRNCGCAGNEEPCRRRNNGCKDPYDCDDEYDVRKNNIIDDQNDFYTARRNECGCRNCDVDEVNTRYPHCDEDDDNDDMTLAIAYVKNQRINTRTVKNCDDALEAGTMFDELEKPFTATGGDHCDTY